MNEGPAADLAGWKQVLRSLHNRLVEMPAHSFSPPDGCAEVRIAWLERFAALNEEVANGVSISDLLYATQCYLRVLQRKLARPNLGDIFPLMAELRLLACNNTHETRLYEPDSATIERVLDECAAFVVFVFSSDRAQVAGKLPAASPELPAELRARVQSARCLEFQQPAKDAVQDGTLTTADNLDQQSGFFWSKSTESVLRNFVGFASRVAHSLEFDSYVLGKMNRRDEPRLAADIATPERRLKLQSWMQKQALVEQSSEFMLDFRKLVIEESLPRNSMYAMNSRKSSRVNKSTAVDSLLQDECGFLALNRLASLTSEPLPAIASDTTHEVHAHLLLALFHYRFQQTTKKKFVHQHYITRQRLCQSDAMREFATKVKWGMNQRPVIVQLKKVLCVLDVTGPDSFDRTGGEAAKSVEYVLCRDMYEALLYWAHLMVTKYNNELLCATCVRSAYEPFV
jgi:hypothetical protein